MANRNKVLGQARVKYDGELLETDGQSQMELGGPVRTAVRGDYQAGAFSEATAESKLTANVLIKAGLSLVGLRNIDNATVTFEADTGQTYIVRNAYVADVISFSSGEGKAAVVFQGPPAEEML
ncbi:hypothetical protein D1610_11685 [Sphingomonas gilva]|uniref:Phage tail protein n=1 Tax=Sphingomonas gilva TaxID=2305907 RepID=A0A396RLH8_9SPHN|nr:phage tail tube protein [Sphingomonas gilva]RHW17204.1 hypothetical protein D1610_11685 [Sphingomonas gilva]